MLLEELDLCGRKSRISSLSFQYKTELVIDPSSWFDLWLYLDRPITLDILMYPLQTFIMDRPSLTNESIINLNSLLIDAFVHWCQSSPFEFLKRFDAEQLIRRSHGSNYIILVLYYFVKRSFPIISGQSYESSFQRVMKKRIITSPILHQWLNFVVKSHPQQISNTEFIVLSVLLSSRLGKYWREKAAHSDSMISRCHGSDEVSEHAIDV